MASSTGKLGVLHAPRKVRVTRYFLFMNVVIRLLLMVSVSAILASAEETLVLNERSSVRLALENNFTIASESLSPEISIQRLIGSRGTYDAFANFGYRIDDDPRAPITDNRGYTFGLSGILNTGTSYSFNIQGDDERAGSLGGFSPLVRSTLSLSLQQSLLRDFGGRDARTTVRLAELQRDSSMLFFEAVVMDGVANASLAYFDLNLAIQNVNVAKRARELTEALLEDNRVRVGAGTMAETDLLIAESALRQRDEQVIISESQLDAQMVLMKQIISNKEGRQLEHLHLEVDTPPTPVWYEFDVESDAETALEKRPEYQVVLNQIESAEVIIKNLKSKRLPDVRLEATYGMRSDESDILGGIEAFEEGNDAFYGVGVVVSKPFQNRSARSDARISQIQLEQIKYDLASTRQNVQVNVNRASRLLERNWNRVEISEHARELAEQSLIAEERKLEFGQSTTLDVLNLQNSLASAEGRVQQAVADYHKAVVNYRNLIGTILEFYQVDVQGLVRSE